MSDEQTSVYAEAAAQVVVDELIALCLRTCRRTYHGYSLEISKILEAECQCYCVNKVEAGDERRYWGTKDGIAWEIQLIP